MKLNSFLKHFEIYTGSDIINLHLFNLQICKIDVYNIKVKSCTGTSKKVSGRVKITKSHCMLAC